MTNYSKHLNRTASVLGALVLTLASIQARADGGMGAPGEWVQLRTPQGCLVYWIGYFPGSMTLQQYYDYNKVEYKGSGCEPGKLANGEGELLIYRDGHLDMRMRGRMIDGVLNGSGSMAYTNDPYWDQDFQRGCPVPWVSEGGCVPFSGHAYGLSSTQSPNPHGSGTGQLATTAPVAVEDRIIAEGNVWKTCITTEEPTQSGIQMIYAFRNNCTKAVTISFCMKATFEAAGDWGLCSNREYHTYDVKAGSRFEFPFTPVQVGSAMSDGRIVDRQEVSASGAACIGSSPSVYVEDSSVVFQHC